MTQITGIAVTDVKKEAFLTRHELSQARTANRLTDLEWTNYNGQAFVWLLGSRNEEEMSAHREKRNERMWGTQTKVISTDDSDGNY